MDSLGKADIKGKRVRVTDDSGCKFVGTVDYADYQRGKLGVTGAVEGHGGVKSLQIFFRSDIKKIVVFDDKPAVFAQIPSPAPTPSASSLPKRSSAHNTNKQTNTSQPSYVLMPGGAEYRGGKYKAGARMVQDTMGSAGETSDSSDKGRSNGTPSSPTSSTPDAPGAAGVWQPSGSSMMSGISATRPRPSQVYARVADTSLPPSQVLRPPTTSTSAKYSTVNHPSVTHNTSQTYPPALPSNNARYLTKSTDSAGYPCYLIPSVVTVPNLPTRDRDRALTRGVKEFLWPSVVTPPTFTTPARLYYVAREGDLFEEAVVRLSTCSRIGLSMEGQVLGRNGKTSLLVISSLEEVFVFDLLNMGENAFKWGLYSVLRNKEVVKMVHDCRQLSDTLYHQYGLELENVFDTLAGHVVFSNWVAKSDHRLAKPLDQTIRDYLGVPDEHLHTTHSSSSTLKAETSVWLGRPLTDQMLLGAARNCMYLLSLARIMERAIQLPMEMAVKALMSSSTTTDNETARQMVLTPQYMPREVQSSLPVWKQAQCSGRG